MNIRTSLSSISAADFSALGGEEERRGGSKEEAKSCLGATGAGEAGASDTALI
jgi:hypothetical protein